MVNADLRKELPVVIFSNQHEFEVNSQTFVYLFLSVYFKTNVTLFI